MSTELISMEESRDLVRLEGIVEAGLQTFVEVGEALAEIRDRKLYRVEHATFDDYLKTKWKISRSWACRQIQAAETVRMLPTGNKPTAERHIRPLGKLPPEQRAEAWQEAVESSPTGTPTARDVGTVVDKKLKTRTDAPAKPATGLAPRLNGTRDERGTTDGEHPEKPLHQITRLITRLWPQLSGEDRSLLSNCIDGLRGGQ